MTEQIVLAYRAELEALISRREAMKAANEFRAHNGQAQAYPGHDFFHLAEEFASLEKRILETE